MTRSAQSTAQIIADLVRRVEGLERGPRLANASIHNQTIPIYDDGEVVRQTLGLQEDGTFTLVDSNGPPPPVPSVPVIEARAGTLVVTWDGGFAGGATAPLDWDHVEVHVSTVSGYTPTDDTEVITFHSLKGGSVTLALDAVPQYVVLQAVSTSRVESAPTVEVAATPLPVATTGGVQTYYENDPPAGLDADDNGALWYDTNDGNHPYRWDGGTLAWISIQDAAIAAAQATADDALAEATTDGAAPTASPDPFALAGLGMFIARWAPIVNADPVRYEVHVSATLGFTATAGDSDTLVGTTSGSQFVVRALPGPEPDPGDPDPRTLVYGTTYYVRIIAIDDDGAAPQSLQAVASVFQVTGIDIAFDSVAAGHIVTGTLTGDLFAATVIFAGTFKTAETGQRVWTGTSGIQGYRSDGSLMISIPTEDGQEILLDGEIIARGMTVIGGASFESLENEFRADSAVTLMRGLTAPSASPQVQVAYDTLQPSTAGLTALQKTNTDPDFGLGGPFDLVPSEVSHIEWRTDSGGYFVIHQQRTNGTRSWHFDAAGAPVDIFGTGVYFSDLKDWETWSTTVMTTSSAPKNGTYVLFRFIPNNTYYVSAPVGINRYSRQNGVAPPCIGNNGADLYIAEVISSTHLNIRYFVPDGSGGNMPAPTVAYESTAGYTAAAGLCAITNGSFDMGGARYMTAERNNGTNVRMLVTSGTNANSIFPGGTSLNWGSANLQAETFESPTTNRKGVAWDGTQFWTYSGDGFLYKHTGEKWDPVVASSVYWGQLTFYDSDAAGTGTHETMPGVFKSYVAKRRSKNTLVIPPIPDNGGTDDPNTIRFYIGRGATQPSNANMHLQYEGSTNTSFTTLATATATPPTSSNFPATNAAKIRNDDDGLVIDGTGLGKFVTLRRGADDVAIQGPYGYFILNGAHTTAGTAAFSNITNWQAEVTAFGIVLGSGTTATVPRAGRYRVTLQISYPASANAGSIWADVRKNGAVTPLLSTLVPPTTANSGTVAGSKTVTLAANDTLQCRSCKSSAGTAAIGTSAELTFWQIEWVGP